MCSKTPSAIICHWFMWIRRIFNQFSKRQNLTIFAINIAGNALYFYFSSAILYFLLLYYKPIVNNHVAFILGNVIDLYAMQKESGIYKYCLIEEATIPLHMISQVPYIHLYMHWWLWEWPSHVQFTKYYIVLISGIVSIVLVKW